MLSKIQLQRTPKQLQQHLKARLGNSRVVPALAKFITNESIYTISVSKEQAREDRGTIIVPKLTLCPSNFIKAEQNSLLMQSLANQISTLRRDMGIIFTEDL